jgi:hypothetical protein
MNFGFPRTNSTGTLPQYRESAFGAVLGAFAGARILRVQSPRVVIYSLQ